MSLLMDNLETSCLTSPDCHPSRIETSLEGLRNFGSDQPRRPPLPASYPLQDWNFSWRTWCGGLVCRDYCCIPQGYRLVAIAFAIYTFSQTATHTNSEGRVQMEITQLPVILLNNFAEQHVWTAVFRTHFLFSSLGFCYSESMLPNVSHVIVLHQVSSRVFHEHTQLEILTLEVSYVTTKIINQQKDTSNGI